MLASPTADRGLTFPTPAECQGVKHRRKESKRSYIVLRQRRQQHGKARSAPKGESTNWNHVEILKSSTCFFPSPGVAVGKRIQKYRHLRGPRERAERPWGRTNPEGWRNPRDRAVSRTEEGWHRAPCTRGSGPSGRARRVWEGLRAEADTAACGAAMAPVKLTDSNAPTCMERSVG